MADHHLAQLNVGILNAPLDAPSMAGFVDNLTPINALADASPGFVWRYTDEGRDDATEARPFGDDLLINFSVWESREALWEFTYRSEHIDLLRRRREWFQHMRDVTLVLWWIPAAHIPTLDEAGERLALLRRHGPTAEAFTFKDSFAPPKTPASSITSGTPL
ncbi:DUF3291 domain-containing protein [Nocardiopsis gilva YIM 90087]|uniref:DUF3291 domain-containing protein n=1 Tax=Nocardiopsis gilva YIM 90087 TaxID=1235441 RepID=A0A223S1V5_9ACTN|nr:DUF3291 domain-containing protein [Nocardiopsis gilva]ASU82088.1 DUF3291 domain-containing protein [Nocardiopsis gilva YIM 90087]